MTQVVPQVSSLAPPTDVAAAPVERTDTEQDSRGSGAPESFLVAAAGTTAVSYYLSTVLHLVAYAVAAVVFASVSELWEADEDVTPIRASLDETDREADQPQFEVVQPMDLGQSQGESQVQQLSNSLRAVENGLVDTLDRDLLPSVLKGEADDGDGEGEFLFRIPESGLAVTKGSFTVWTSPEHPTPRRPYRIIIEVKLKEGVRMYRPSDLSGYVIGSDSYRQKIPFDSQKPNNSFFSNEEQQLEKLSLRKPIKIRNNKVQLVIEVPGAERLVKDIIQIRSRRLREQQELELVFGQRPE